MPGRVGILIAGRYLLHEPVGQDDMGQTWRAYDQLLEREVALKEVQLPARSTQEHADQLAEMMRAARAAAKVDRPGAATVYDVIEHDDAPWIVMRLVASPSPRQETVTHPPAEPAAPRRRAPFTGALADAARTNPRLAAGLATAVIMIVALILVTTIFPSHGKGQPPGSPPASPGHSAPP